MVRKYLGTCHSDAIEWTPLPRPLALDLFPGFGDAADRLNNDPWQFGNSSCTDRAGHRGGYS